MLRKPQAPSVFDLMVVAAALSRAEFARPVRMSCEHCYATLDENKYEVRAIAFWGEGPSRYVFVEVEAHGARRDWHISILVKHFNGDIEAAVVDIPDDARLPRNWETVIIKALEKLVADRRTPIFPN